MAVTGMRTIDMQRKKNFIFSTWGLVIPTSPPSYKERKEIVTSH